MTQHPGWILWRKHFRYIPECSPAGMSPSHPMLPLGQFYHQWWHFDWPQALSLGCVHKYKSKRCLTAFNCPSLLFAEDNIFKWLYFRLFTMLYQSSKAGIWTMVIVAFWGPRAPGSISKEKKLQLSRPHLLIELSFAFGGENMFLTNILS